MSAGISRAAGRARAVLPYVALFLALGGTAYAASKIGTSDIKRNAIVSKLIRNGQVTGADVREASLRNVPSASRVNGVGAEEIDFRTSQGVSNRTVFSRGGLQVSANCNPGAAQDNKTSIFLASTVDNASLTGTNTKLNEPPNAANPQSVNYPNFNTTVFPLIGSVSNFQTPSLLELVYSHRSGDQVHLTLAIGDNRHGGAGPVCSAIGSAMVVD